MQKFTMHLLVLSLMLVCARQVGGGVVPIDSQDGHRYYVSTGGQPSEDFVAKGLRGGEEDYDGETDYIGILVDTSPVKKAALAQQVAPAPVPYRYAY